MTDEASSRDDRDYGAMEAALSETARGRWFLSEHARRHRGHDTRILLDAIGRIEASVAARPSLAAPAVPDSREPASGGVVLGEPGDDLSEIALMVGRIRDAFAGARPQESLPRLSEAATSDVLDATERIQEAAWTLRERGADPATCDLLDQRATEIYAACAVQDGLARRVAAGVELVRSLSERLGRTRATGNGPVAPAPASARPGTPGGQRVADRDIAKARAPAPSEEAAAWPLTAPTHEDDAGDEEAGGRHAGAPGFARAPLGVGGHPATLDAIEALDVHARLRLFT